MYILFTFLIINNKKGMRTTDLDVLILISYNQSARIENQ